MFSPKYQQLLGTRHLRLPLSVLSVRMLEDKFSPPALLPSATTWFGAVTIGTAAGCPLVWAEEIEKIFLKAISRSCLSLCALFTRVSKVMFHIVEFFYSGVYSAWLYSYIRLYHLTQMTGVPASPRLLLTVVSFMLHFISMQVTVVARQSCSSFRVKLFKFAISGSWPFRYQAFWSYSRPLTIYECLTLICWVTWSRDTVTVSVLMEMSLTY